ncbi:MAG: DUF401 family protein [bacterium]|nr:DUF401 family protein [bacterium]
MTVYFKLILILAIIISMMKLKISMGISLIFSSLIIGFLFFESFVEIPLAFISSVTSYATVKTVLIVYGVLLLSHVMKERQVDRMIGGLTRIFRNIKYAIIIPPMLLGLLPMPGGAMLPAAIIDSLGTPLKLSPEMKTYINYWFRHIWEYFWPLYPGLILTASIVRLPIKSIMIHQFYLTILAFVIGLTVISFIKEKALNEGQRDARSGIISLARSIFPIVVMIVLIMATPLSEEIVVLGVTVLYLALTKMTLKKKLLSFFKSFSADSILLIIGVMIFKDFLIHSKALDFLANGMDGRALSVYALLVLMPFTMGLLTGINQAYVGIALPIAVPLIVSAGGVDFARLTLFYASGFAGVLLSPVHLCLSLTKEYYKANWGPIYRILAPSVIPILLLPILADLIF